MNIYFLLGWSNFLFGKNIVRDDEIKIDFVNYMYYLFTLM
jgi:hypothetical protein